ncbi:riboflavin biosynthesis protein RibD [Agaricicola taiwanensis]|uniref:Riboflavin biosynthesis protein RibD n=1 Tax=Agaricicola taiwanensis TaxID=591372 RepID=A0A8J3DWC2_9RHOB|nr:bifunctional diaminohydroxyphosphoribosylaminopyrimidine deaminase/5-amino-6-(5-phosphoribosylamino)uracil reductase RibD [Agaricicola taiwanensis]GGE46367.1 riboflavin biosynthesis protein RibD [Agaricicola taiwanensis]
MNAHDMPQNSVTASLHYDERYMEAALSYGRRGMGTTAPNPSVGAVVVVDNGNGGRIVGAGWTQPGGRPHAETVALAEAGEAARGSTLYVTLEPCSHHGKTPPCVDAIRAAGVRRVVVATVDPDSRVSGRGIEILRQAGLRVTVGICEAQALRDHLGHIRRATLGRPMVQLKMALSRDGMVGLRGPRPAVISSPESFGRAHMLRAQSDAIMIGVGTALADDPQLTCRLPGLEHRSPVRFVVDARLRLPLDSKLVRSARKVPVKVITTETAPVGPEIALRAAGIDVLRVRETLPGRIDLPAMLGLLGTMGLTRVMVEGGPTLANALLDEGLIDEALMVAGDVVIGGEGLPAFDEPVEERLWRAGLAATSTFRVGPDVMTLYQIS